MKKSQLPGAILALLIPALIVLSPTVFAEESVNEHQGSQNAVNTGTRQWGVPPRSRAWTIPPISRQWGVPPKSKPWTIPPINKRWGVPQRSSHWTIPKSASDMKPSSEGDDSTRAYGRTPMR